MTNTSILDVHTPNSGCLYCDHNFSIVLLAVSDTNHSFTYVDAGAYGSQITEDTEDTEGFMGYFIIILEFLGRYLCSVCIWKCRNTYNFTFRT